MDTIKVTGITGTEIEISEQNFQKAIIHYLRETSPDRVKIIAEEQNHDGQPKPVPVAILMLAKNPAEVMSYTDLIPLEPEPEQ